MTDTLSSNSCKSSAAVQLLLVSKPDQAPTAAAALAALVVTLMAMSSLGSVDLPVHLLHGVAGTTTGTTNAVHPLVRQVVLLLGPETVEVVARILAMVETRITVADRATTMEGRHLPRPRELLPPGIRLLRLHQRLLEGMADIQVLSTATCPLTALLRACLHLLLVESLLLPAALLATSRL
jgi:hypothetical protein